MDELEQSREIIVICAMVRIHSMVGHNPVITLCDSTRSEIEYALAHGKKVEYLLSMKSQYKINYEAPSTTVVEVKTERGILILSDPGVGIDD